MPSRPIPELLSPAGSLDAALGAERFNARDDGAQLTLDELDQACRLAHSRGARVYLTLNTLIKPGELTDALALLGECVDRGIDAVIVQDIGLDSKDEHLLEVMISLAHRIGAQVVAEGVEEENQLEWLRQAGCDYVQGYLIGQPVAADDVRPAVKT